MNIDPLRKVLQRKIYTPSKGAQVTIIMPINPYLTIKPVEYVHQTPLSKTNKFSKTL
jgi:hypothetical protein